MNKMKNYIIGFILGAIICSSITAYAVSLASKDITFIPENENWQVTNVEEALDDLYSVADDKKCDTTNSKSLYLISDNQAFDTTHATTSYTYTYDISGYDGYQNLSIDNFYIMINSYGPAAYKANGSTSTNLRNFSKSYDSNTGTLTVTAPLLAYSSSGIGVWLDVSIYLYY